MIEALKPEGILEEQIVVFKIIDVGFRLGEGLFIIKKYSIMDIVRMQKIA